MDPTKDIGEYKKEWFEKVDAASTALFKIAEDCVKADPNLNVIIVKRPQRFDKSSKDIMGIKPKLSEFGNKAYDQLLMKSGFSDRIHLAELNLVQNSGYLKDIIYGRHEDQRYDGIHFNGSESSGHFTYRAVQSMFPIIWKTKTSQQPPFFAPQHKAVPTVIKLPGEQIITVTISMMTVRKPGL